MGIGGIGVKVKSYTSGPNDLLWKDSAMGVKKTINEEGHVEQRRRHTPTHIHKHTKANAHTHHTRLSDIQSQPPQTTKI